MDDTIEHARIKKNTLLSTVSLFVQSGYSAMLGLGANLVLTIVLTPKIFGIYITTLSLIAFLNYFSDIGLAASLIQKKELTKDDIKTTFSVQQILIITLIVIALIVTKPVTDFYKLPQEGVYLYWALLFAFFISSLKTIPSIFLERDIQFQKIVLVQIIENTSFYISVIVLALLNFGLASFTISVILRAVVGLIVMYSISFWVPQVGISFKSLRSLLSFGIPFQASSFLALFKDDFIILFLGKVLGFEAVGYIGWAKKWAEAPIRIIMDNLTRVMFPLIASFQFDKQKVSSIIQKMFYYQTAVLTPVMIGAAFIMSDIVALLPRYQKWEPSISLFYIFVLSSFIISFFAPLINLFNALGKAKLSFSFMLLWTGMMWTLTPFLTTYHGLYGFPFAHIIVSISYILVYFAAQRIVRFNLFSSIYKFLLAGVIMAIGLVILKAVLPVSFISLCILTLSGALLYIGSLQFIFNIKIKKEIDAFVHIRSSV